MDPGFYIRIITAGVIILLSIANLIYYKVARGETFIECIKKRKGSFSLYVLVSVWLIFSALR